jgi:hypothetical protein
VENQRFFTHLLQLSATRTSGEISTGGGRAVMTSSGHQSGQVSFFIICITRITKTGVQTGFLLVQASRFR